MAGCKKTAANPLQSPLQNPPKTCGKKNKVLEGEEGGEQPPFFLHRNGNFFR